VTRLPDGARIGGWAANATAGILVLKGATGPEGPPGKDGTDGADGAGVPPGGTTGQVLAKASSADDDTAWIDPPSSGIQLLASKVFNGTPPAAISSTSPVDIDATNLAVTFTVPASGNVLVVLDAVHALPAAGNAIFWSLRQGSSNVVGSARQLVFGSAAFTSGNIRSHVGIRLTGLTPGSSVTYKWAGFASAAGSIRYVWTGTPAGGEFTGNASNYGPATMLVYSA